MNIYSYSLRLFKIDPVVSVLPATNQQYYKQHTTKHYSILQKIAYYFKKILIQKDSILLATCYKKIDKIAYTTVTGF